MLHAPADAAARIHSGDSFTRLMSIHLVNPSHVSFGIGVITPRWLYVLAAATPEHYGPPIVVDETLEAIDFSTIKAGDMILTGSVHPPAFLPGTGVARTEFEGLGGTEITIR